MATRKTTAKTAATPEQTPATDTAKASTGKAATAKTATKPAAKAAAKPAPATKVAAAPAKTATKKAPAKKAGKVTAEQAAPASAPVEVAEKPAKAAPAKAAKAAPAKPERKAESVRNAVGEYVRWQQINRQTKTVVQILDLKGDGSTEQPFERDGKTMKWAARCVDHDVKVHFAAYDKAARAAAQPAGWCKPCEKVA